MSKTTERLQYLIEEQGFDQSYIVRGGMIRIKCSQCEAAVINGIGTHEHGCPNAAKARRVAEGDDDE